jgi:uncharacterized damage-inducible protein DinB
MDWTTPMPAGERDVTIVGATPARNPGDHMSVFTNPASGAPEHREQYSTALLELLGDREPMAILRSTTAWCDEATADLTAAQLRDPERAGKWSIVAVLQHLADSELVWGYRLRKVLAEDRPELTGYDQDRWAERMGYAHASRDAALGVFRVLRDANLRLLEAAEDPDLDRVGVHAERGEESVRHMMRLYAGHDLVHRNQITRIRQVVGS